MALSLLCVPVMGFASYFAALSGEEASVKNGKDGVMTLKVENVPDHVLLLSDDRKKKIMVPKVQFIKRWNETFPEGTNIYVTGKNFRSADNEPLALHITAVKNDGDDLNFTATKAFNMDAKQLDGKKAKNPIVVLDDFDWGGTENG